MAHVNDSAGSTPGSQTRRQRRTGWCPTACPGPAQVGLSRLPRISSLRVRVQKGKRSDCHPSTDTHLLRSDHLSEQFLQAGFIGIYAIRRNRQFQSRSPVLSNASVAAAGNPAEERFCTLAVPDVYAPAMQPARRQPEGFWSRFVPAGGRRLWRRMSFLAVPCLDRSLEAVFSPIASSQPFSASDAAARAAIRVPLENPRFVVVKNPAVIRPGRSSRPSLRLDEVWIRRCGPSVVDAPSPK